MTSTCAAPCFAVALLGSTTMVTSTILWVAFSYVGPAIAFQRGTVALASLVENTLLPVSRALLASSPFSPSWLLAPAGSGIAVVGAKSTGWSFSAHGVAWYSLMGVPATAARILPVGADTHGVQLARFSGIAALTVVVQV